MYNRHTTFWQTITHKNYSLNKLCTKFRVTSTNNHT